MASRNSCLVINTGAEHLTGVNGFGSTLKHFESESESDFFCPWVSKVCPLYSVMRYTLEAEDKRSQIQTQTQNASKSNQSHSPQSNAPLERKERFEFCFFPSLTANNA